MWRLPLFAALVTLYVAASLSCVGPGYHYDVYIDPSFNAEELTAIERGERVWEGAIPGLYFTTHIGYNNSNWNTISIFQSIAPTTGESVGEHALGITHRDPATEHSNITLFTTIIAKAGETYPIYPYHTWDMVPTHEIGHALGLEHTDQFLHNHTGGEGTLMHATIDHAAGAPTCIDITQFYYVRGEHAFPCGAETIDGGETLDGSASEDVGPSSSQHDALEGPSAD